jgi:Tfp pilus assembly protein PilN
MVKINLIFPQYIEKLKQKTKNVQISVVLVLVGLVIAAVTSLHITKTYSTEKLLSKKQAELKTLQDKVDKLKEMERIKKEIAAHLKALETLLDKRFDYPYFMQDAAKTIAKTIKFRSFRTVSDDEGVVEFDITAQASIGDDIGNWIKNLEEDEKFSNITLGAVGVERDEGSGKEIYYFPVLGTYFARPKLPVPPEQKVPQEEGNKKPPAEGKK